MILKQSLLVLAYSSRKFLRRFSASPVGEPVYFHYASLSIGYLTGFLAPRSYIYNVVQTMSRDGCEYMSPAYPIDCIAANPHMDCVIINYLSCAKITFCSS